MVHFAIYLYLQHPQQLCHLCANAIMKLFSPTNDLPLWLCTLVLKEDYARIRIWAKCELQLEVLSNTKLNWNLGQMEASKSNMHSCTKIHVRHQKLKNKGFANS